LRWLISLPPKGFKLFLLITISALLFHPAMSETEGDSHL